MRTALTDLSAEGTKVRITFNEVDPVQLVEIGENRSTACLLHTGAAGRDA
jgi:hypothetical protein